MQRAISGGKVIYLLARLFIYNLESWLTSRQLDIIELISLYSTHNATHTFKL